MKNIFILLSFMGAMAFAEVSKLPASIEGNSSLKGHVPIKMALNDPENDMTVVIFLSAKCPCSASHEPVLKKMAEEYSVKKVKFIAVHANADESAELSEAHFTQAALPFEVIEDPDQKLANVFGAIKTPHAYVLKNGEILFQGGVDDSSMASSSKKHYLNDALAAIVGGKKPEISVVRALGCVIKRK